MKKHQAEKLGKVMADWNARKLDAGKAMDRITKIFPRIFIREWNKHYGVKEGEKKGKEKPE